MAYIEETELVCQRGLNFGLCGFRVGPAYFVAHPNFAPSCPNCGGAIIVTSERYSDDPSDEYYFDRAARRPRPLGAAGIDPK